MTMYDEIFNFIVKNIYNGIYLFLIIIGVFYILYSLYTFYVFLYRNTVNLSRLFIFIFVFYNFFGFLFFILNLFSLIVLLFIVFLYFFGDNNFIIKIYQKIYYYIFGSKLDAEVLLENYWRVFMEGFYGYDNAGPAYTSHEKMNDGAECYQGYSRSMEELTFLSEIWTDEYYDYLTLFFYKRQVYTPTYWPLTEQTFTLQSDHNLLIGYTFFELGGLLSHLIICFLLYVLLLNIGYVYQYIFWSKLERLSYKYTKLYYKEFGRSQSLRSRRGFYKYLDYFYRRELFLYNLGIKIIGTRSNKIDYRDEIDLDNNYYYGGSYNYYYDKNFLLMNYYKKITCKSDSFIYKELELSKLYNYLFFYGSDTNLPFEKFYLSSSWYWNNINFMKFNFDDIDLEDKKTSIDFYLSRYLINGSIFQEDYSIGANSLIYYYGTHSLDGKFGDILNLFIPYISQSDTSQVVVERLDDIAISLEEDEDYPMMYGSEDEDVTDGYRSAYDLILNQYLELYNEDWWLSRSLLSYDIPDIDYLRGYIDFFGSNYSNNICNSFFLLKELKKSDDEYYYYSNIDVSDDDADEHTLYWPSINLWGSGLKGLFGDAYDTKLNFSIIEGGLFIFFYCLYEQDYFLWDGKEGFDYLIFGKWFEHSVRGEDLDLYYLNYSPELEAFFYAQDFYFEELDFFDLEEPDVEVVSISFSLFDFINMVYDLFLFFGIYMYFLGIYFYSLFSIASMFKYIYINYCFELYNLNYIQGGNILWGVLYILLVLVIFSLLYNIYEFLLLRGIFLKFKLLKKKKKKV